MNENKDMVNNNANNFNNDNYNNQNETNYNFQNGENIVSNNQQTIYQNQTENLDDVVNQVVQTQVDDNVANVNEFQQNNAEPTNATPMYEEVYIKKNPNAMRTDSYFDGKLLELIGWTLLKNLITIITLGIALPWGQCMLMRYQIEHTVLNGKRLKFDGTGGSFFVEKFKWFFFTLITLGIYAFWIPVKRYKWILSNVHFEDEHLIKDESFFDGKTLHLIGINILCNTLNIVSFGLLYAFTWCFKLRWLAKHSVINRKKIVFDGKSINLFGKYILWFFLTIITFGIYGFWLGIKLSKWEVKNTHIKVANETYQKDNTLLYLIIAFVVLIPLAIVIISNINFGAIIGSDQNGNSTGGLFGGSSAQSSIFGNDTDSIESTVQFSPY